MALQTVAHAKSSRTDTTKGVKVHLHTVYPGKAVVDEKFVVLDVDAALAAKSGKPLWDCGRAFPLVVQHLTVRAVRALAVQYRADTCVYRTEQTRVTVQSLR